MLRNLTSKTKGVIPQQKSTSTAYRVDQHPSQPITYNSDRFSSSSNSVYPHDTASVFGSTFANMKGGLGNQAHEVREGHVLDSGYSAFKYDTNGNLIAGAVAIADGCGGHYGVEGQDKAIAYIGKKAAKLAVELGLQNITQVQSEAQLRTLFTQVNASLTNAQRRKTPGFAETSTLAVAYIYPGENGTISVSTLNIGDSILFGWSPSLRQFYMLSSGKLDEFGPAMMPHNDPRNLANDVRCNIHTNLPKDTLIFAASDGLTEHLPVQTRKITQSITSTHNKGALAEERVTKDVEFSETILDENYMTELLGSVDSTKPVSFYTKAITVACAELAEEQRKKDYAVIAQINQGQVDQQETPVNLGDDFGLQAIRMPSDLSCQIAAQIAEAQDPKKAAAATSFFNTNRVSPQEQSIVKKALADASQKAMRREPKVLVQQVLDGLQTQGYQVTKIALAPDQGAHSLFGMKYGLRQWQGVPVMKFYFANDEDRVNFVNEFTKEYAKGKLISKCTTGKDAEGFFVVASAQDGGRNICRAIGLSDKLVDNIIRSYQDLMSTQKPEKTQVMTRSLCR